MKKTAGFIAVLIACFFTLFTSCQNEIKKEADGFATITFNLNFDKIKSRAIVSKEFDSIDNESLIFVLKYKANTASDWSQTSFDGLSKMKNANIELEFGTYSFTLNAYESSEYEENADDVKSIYTCTLDNVEIEDYEASLTFDLSYGTATGTIEYTVTYPSNDNLELTILIKKINGGSGIQESLTGTSYEGKFCDVEKENYTTTTKNDSISTAVFTVDTAETGDYVVSLKLAYIINSDEEDTWFMDQNVPVGSGSTTKTTYNFDNYNAIYTISYEGLNSLELNNLSTTYKKYHKTSYPDLSSYNDTLKKTFLGWKYSTGDSESISLTTTTENGETKYILNSDYSLASNVTVTAEWEDWGESQLTVTDINDFEINTETSVFYNNADSFVFNLTGNLISSGVEGITYIWDLNGVTLEDQNTSSLTISPKTTMELTDGSNTLTVFVKYNDLSASKSITFEIIEPPVLQ